MADFLEQITPYLINDAVDKKRVLFVSDSFTGDVASSALSAESFFLLCPNIELRSRYRKLLKNNKKISFVFLADIEKIKYDLVIFDAKGFNTYGEELSEFVKRADTVIIFFANGFAETAQYSGYKNRAVYGLNVSGAMVELKTDIDAAAGIAVLSNKKISLKKNYSISTSVAQMVSDNSEKLKQQNFALNEKVNIQGQIIDMLQTEITRLNSRKILLKGPFIVTKRFIKRVLNAFAPTRLVLKFIKNLREGGTRSALNRVRSYLGLSVKGNAQGESFVFHNSDEYIDVDSEYQKNIDFSGNTTDVKVLAYYLPQYHAFKENDEWWGKGFTEWNNTSVAIPRFAGHYQPRIPHNDIGYYDLSDINTMKKQAALAKQHGIYGFCFYYYWFSGKRLMEKPVDMLLEHSEIDLPFCLCWANENWTRAWDGQNRNVLIAQDYSDSDDERFMMDMKKYIDDKRYIRINGKPLVMVYNPGQIPDCQKSFAKWREVARDIGIGEILIWTCQTANNTAQTLGIEDCIDSEVEFPPHNTWLKEFAVHGVNLRGKSANLLNYQKLVEGWTQLYRNTKGKKQTVRAVHHSCMMAWDNAARRKNNWFTYHHFSLKSLYDWMQLICTRAREDFSEEERFVFINAWNEWAEGTYLEPDEKYGYANINTVSKALYNIPLVDDIEFLSNKNKPLDDFNKKIAVQVHMFYTETLDETIENLNKIPYKFDCLVSTNTQEKADIISAALKEKCKCNDYSVEVFENRGRDVAPFIMQLKNLIDDYDYICHIHSKRTVTGDHGNDWREYIFRNMFGSSEYLKRLFALFENNDRLGMIFPETFPPLEYQAGWGGNLAGCRDIMDRLDIEVNFPQNPVFPVGNMFWAKSEAVRPLFKADIKLKDFAEEAGQVNATIAHCIERSWVYVAKSFGFGYKKVMNNCIPEITLGLKRRIAFYMHYNAQNCLSNDDELSLLEYAKIYEKIVFVSNSPLNDDSMARLEKITDTVFVRENSGFDFGGWKYAFEQFGYEKIKEYDSVTLVNNSTFAPVFDLKVMFDKMENENLDFWGVTLFPSIKDGSYIGKKSIPEHIQSYFVVFEKNVVQSTAIKDFFDSAITAQSFTQAVASGEVRLTEFMKKRGFSYAPYLRESYYICSYLGNMSLPYDKPATLLLLGSPLVKKKAYSYMVPAERAKLEYLIDKLKG